MHPLFTDLTQQIPSAVDAICAEGGKATGSKIGDRLGVSNGSARQAIMRAKKRGLIQRADNGKYCGYVLVEKSE